MLWWALENTVVNILDQSRKGDDRPVIAKFENTGVFESLVLLFWGMTWWPGWKVGKTQKPNNYLKSMSGEPLVAESWFAPLNDHKTWFTMAVLRHV